jgi:hypothetical protein
MTTWSSISGTSKSQTRISLDSATGSYLIVGTTINMIHVYPFETWHVHKKSWETHTSQTVRSNITGLIEGKHETKARFWQLDFNVFLQQNHLSEEPPTDIDSNSWDIQIPKRNSLNYCVSKKDISQFTEFIARKNMRKQWAGGFPKKSNQNCNLLALQGTVSVPIFCSIPPC